MNAIGHGSIARFRGGVVREGVERLCRRDPRPTPISVAEAGWSAGRDSRRQSDQANGRSGVPNRAWRGLGATTDGDP
jgi:hypothetical protein